MPTLLKILITGLLVLMAVALGTEVVALHRGAMATEKRPTHPVVVRKVVSPAEHRKAVLPVIY